MKASIAKKSLTARALLLLLSIAQSGTRGKWQVTLGRQRVNWGG